ncbi:RNA methyltransferase, putative [Plasmodium ovale curtisi]|uniref:RNA methyltransferase, putative n=1 Tax=Plasmodium ovale curtisi TaxID=864141 RepID=A0A1A8VQP2_PLAOA|nr:RNA methyltransferase, putative [Plasmodium ovale curtisi]SBS84259.1 RNA methyltransferase, putative [Plasmodium ovale curtisi]
MIKYVEKHCDDVTETDGVEDVTHPVSGRKDKIKMYVVIYNIGKKKNIGSIVRSCVAFNVSKIFVVGRKKKEINFFGNMGTCDYIRIKHFSKMTELKEYFMQKKILLYGCEITCDSISVTTKPFVNQDTAFLFGNEGTGIDENTLRLCDKVIYIPQYGNGTASLNVSVSCAIILHNFAVWANYDQIQIDKKKFVVHKCESKLDRYLNPSDKVLTEIYNKRVARREKRQETADIGMLIGGIQFDKFVGCIDLDELEAASIQSS